MRLLAAIFFILFGCQAMAIDTPMKSSIDEELTFFGSLEEFRRLGLEIRVSEEDGYLDVWVESIKTHNDSKTGSCNVGLAISLLESNSDEIIVATSLFDISHEDALYHGFTFKQKYRARLVVQVNGDCDKIKLGRYIHDITEIDLGPGQEKHEEKGVSRH